jgi:hypothetical protein
MEDRLKAEFIVTNADGKVTVSMTLGEMKLEDIKSLEAVLLTALLSQLK